MKTGRAIMAALLVLMLPAGLLSSKENRVPPPRNEAEARKLMHLTWDQEILPEGASAKTLERLLAKGEVMIMNDNPPGGIAWMTAAGIMVDAPAETVFGVATDFEHYPDVVPMTSEAAAEPVPGVKNFYEVKFGIELLFSWLSIEYSVYHYHRPPYRTDWAHASGEFDLNCGFWQIIPTPDGKRAMAFYSVYSLPRQAALQAIYKDEPALELMTNVATATMIVRAVKNEAEKRVGEKLTKLKEKSSVEQILLDDPNTLRLLSEKGKIMVLEDGPTVFVTAGAVVDVPVEKAFAAITDFGKYPEFLPGVKSVDLRGQGEKGLKVYQDLQIKLWAFTFDMSDENEYTLTPPERMTWMIKRENGGPIMGFWRLMPLDDNTKSLIFNGATADIRDMGLVPRTALKLEPTLEYGLLAAMTTASMDAFKKRINHAK